MKYRMYYVNKMWTNMLLPFKGAKQEDIYIIVLS